MIKTVDLLPLLRKLCYYPSVIVWFLAGLHQTWWENGKWDKKMSLNLGADLDKGVDPGKDFFVIIAFTAGQGILVISVNSSVNNEWLRIRD